jgi:nucleotide-binding universal stress UspA family protein
MKLLIAIDGSESALRALSYVINHKEFFSANPELVLINVHLPLPSPRAEAYLGSAAIKQYYKEESDEALAPARALLAGTPCRVTERQVVGQPVALIVAAAAQQGCDLIVMGTHGRNALANLLMGSVAMRVIAASPVPVLSVN